MASFVCSIDIRVPESVRRYVGALLGVAVFVMLLQQGIIAI